MAKECAKPSPPPPSLPFPHLIEALHCLHRTCAQDDLVEHRHATANETRVTTLHEYEVWRGVEGVGRCVGRWRKCVGRRGEV